VSKDYSYTLLDPRDLRDFAGLSTCVVTQRQKLALTVGWDLIRWHLEGMFGGVEEGASTEGVSTLRVEYLGLYGVRQANTMDPSQVMGVVDVKHSETHEITLEWDSSASNDMIADSTLALLTSVDTSPASVKSAPKHSNKND
jgi:cleavage and polyadenylation specificity factor subunit 3